MQVGFLLTLATLVVASSAPVKHKTIGQQSLTKRYRSWPWWDKKLDAVLTELKEFGPLVDLAVVTKKRQLPDSSSEAYASQSTDEANFEAQEVEPSSGGVQLGDSTSEMSDGDEFLSP
jgi:hypothetical protein